MILTELEILKEIEQGHIVIQPFDQKCLGTNSYDLHLGNTLAVYVDDQLDVTKDNKIKYIEIPSDGYWLQPNEFYLGVTQEYTETHHHIPYIEGKSSTGRLGITIHDTAGKGDIGFCNYWTLEISCRIPIKIVPGMPIAQITYYKVDHQQITKPYRERINSKYGQVSDKPARSMMWKNFI